MEVLWLVSCTLHRKVRIKTGDTHDTHVAGTPIGDASVSGYPARLSFVPMHTRGYVHVCSIRVKGSSDRAVKRSCNRGTCVAVIWLVPRFL